ncbi:MAG TPA: YfiR family protein [Usitatibacter sp.]|nr:YfiR family protein [Usitatibacter sp.]
MRFAHAVPGASWRCLLLLVMLFVLPAGAATEDSTLAIQRIKAAFLYKFASYVEWPAKAFREADSPIVIGVAGADSIAAELERAVVGRTVSGRPLQVRRVAGGEGVECCQVLFIGAANDPERTRELLTRARGHPVLTVTELESEHPKGSIINFLNATDKVRFDISREAAERNGLQLRSQLLAVARQVSS